MHLLAPALAELAATRWDRGNEDFPPTSFQVSNIHAGTGAGNVVPGSRGGDFNFRFSTESTRGVPACSASRTILKQASAWTTRCPGSLGAQALPQPPGQAARRRCAEAVQAHAGRDAELSTDGGTSDGRFIIDICPEVVELGPVNASIHKLNEHIELGALEQLPQIYLDTLRALLP